MSGAHVERRDVQIQVPLNAITLTGSGATNTRDAQGQFSISLPTNNITYRLGIPCNAVLPFVASGNANIDRLGFKLEELIYWMSIGTENAQAHTLTVNQEAVAGAAARAAATAFGGTVTFDVDDGTSTSLPTTQRANLYKIRAILGTPVYFLTALQLVTAELSIQTGATNGTAKVHGVLLKGRQGIYY